MRVLGRRRREEISRTAKMYVEQLIRRDMAAGVAVDLAAIAKKTRISEPEVDRLYARIRSLPSPAHDTATPCVGISDDVPLGVAVSEGIGANQGAMGNHYRGEAAHG